MAVWKRGLSHSSRGPYSGEYDAKGGSMQNSTPKAILLAFIVLVAVIALRTLGLLRFTTVAD